MNARKVQEPGAPARRGHSRKSEDVQRVPRLSDEQIRREAELIWNAANAPPARRFGENILSPSMTLMPDEEQRIVDILEEMGAAEDESETSNDT